MKRISRHAALAASVALLLAAVAVILDRAGFLAAPDISALWSWSLDSWETTAFGANGERLRIVREPVALARNLALTALAFVGVLLGAGRLLDSFAFGRGARSPATSDALSATSRQIGGELDTILGLVRAHLESNKSYSAALAKGQKDISSVAASPDHIRAAIMLLIAENQKMLRASEEHERDLEASRRQISELRAALAETQELNVRDSLTHIYTRRHFDATLARRVREAHLGEGPLSLLMADIDHFKKINDAYGHPIGDEVLKNFAKTMTRHVAERDTVARYGGEEFAIILPGSTRLEARATAERIRAEFETKNWAIKGGAQIGRITASFGIAELAPGETAESLIRRADAKLYVSKSGGRNLVTTDEHPRANG